MKGREVTSQKPEVGWLFTAPLETFGTPGFWLLTPGS